MKVAVIIDSVPSYRRGFYLELINNPSIDLTVYCQSHIKGFNLKLIHNDLGPSFIEVPSFSLDRHRCVWQRLPISELLRKYDVYFFLGNPRILSNVIFATFFQIIGKKVVIWGQAHTAGANKGTEMLRLRWWHLFNNFLTYTDDEVGYLRRRGFRQENILGMNNGLDQKKIDTAKKSWPSERLTRWKTERSLIQKTILLSCARLEKKNDFSLMVDALPNLIRVLPNIIWCVIGAGQEQESLIDQAKKKGVNNHIVWVGELYAEEELAPWFMSSSILVHPGAIGLTLMHAFGYGLPVVTHDQPTFHMPEICAFKNEFNGLAFRYKDAENLAHTILSLLKDDGRISRFGRNALSTVTEKYNTESMAKRFIAVAQAALGGS